MKSISKYRS